MPRTKSAKRALKKAKRNWLFNENRRNKIKLTVKKFLKFIKEKNIKEAEETLKEVYKQLDKAGKRFIHKNKVARLKSRYSKLLQKLKLTFK